MFRVVTPPENYLADREALLIDDTTDKEFYIGMVVGNGANAVALEIATAVNLKQEIRAVVLQECAEVAMLLGATDVANAILALKLHDNHG